LFGENGIWTLKLNPNQQNQAKNEQAFNLEFQFAGKKTQKTLWNFNPQNWHPLYHNNRDQKQINSAP
jgi:hypothetical protein